MSLFSFFKVFSRPLISALVQYQKHYGPGADGECRSSIMLLILNVVAPGKAAIHPLIVPEEKCGEHTRGYCADITIAWGRFDIGVFTRWKGGATG